MVTREWAEGGVAAAEKTGKACVVVWDAVLSYYRPLGEGETVEQAVEEFRAGYDHGDHCDGGHDPVEGFEFVGGDAG